MPRMFYQSELQTQPQIEAFFGNFIHSLDLAIHSKPNPATIVKHGIATAASYSFS